jgi:hypothetical protein
MVSLLLFTYRDCVAALVPDKKPTPPTAISGTEGKHADKCSCDDDKSIKATKLKEFEVTAQIHFEDSLHNLLYIKRYVTYLIWFLALFSLPRPGLSAVVLDVEFVLVKLAMCQFFLQALWFSPIIYSFGLPYLSFMVRTVSIFEMQ